MLVQKIKTDLLRALKAKEEVKKEVLRYLLSTIKNLEIEKQVAASDQEVLRLIRQQIKKEEEELAYTKQANRQENLKVIEEKIRILKEYLPPQLDEAEIKRRIEELIPSSELSPQNFGRLMGRLVKEFAGQVDNSQLAKVLKSVINDKE